MNKLQSSLRCALAVLADEALAALEAKEKELAQVTAMLTAQSVDVDSLSAELKCQNECVARLLTEVGPLSENIFNFPSDLWHCRALGHLWLCATPRARSIPTLVKRSSVTKRLCYLAGQAEWPPLTLPYGCMSQGQHMTGLVFASPA